VKKCVPINLILYYPKTEEGKRELAQRVADVHAETVKQTVSKLNCSSKQKEQLIDSVIGSVYESEKNKKTINPNYQSP
jgi:DNA-binding PadR family transcriptional regulator